MIKDNDTRKAFDSKNFLLISYYYILRI